MIIFATCNTTVNFVLRTRSHQEISLNTFNLIINKYNLFRRPRLYTREVKYISNCILFYNQCGLEVIFIRLPTYFQKFFIVQIKNSTICLNIFYWATFRFWNMFRLKQMEYFLRLQQHSIFACIFQRSALK